MGTIIKRIITKKCLEVLKMGYNSFNEIH